MWRHLIAIGEPLAFVVVSTALAGIEIWDSVTDLRREKRYGGWEGVE